MKSLFKNLNLLEKFLSILGIGNLIPFLFHFYKEVYSKMSPTTFAISGILNTVFMLWLIYKSFASAKQVKLYTTTPLLIKAFTRYQIDKDLNIYCDVCLKRSPPIYSIMAMHQFPPTDNYQWNSYLLTCTKCPFTTFIDASLYSNLKTEANNVYIKFAASAYYHNH